VDASRKYQKWKKHIVIMLENSSCLYFLFNVSSTKDAK